MLRKHKVEQDGFVYFIYLYLNAMRILYKTYEWYISGVLCQTGRSYRGMYANEYQSETCLRKTGMHLIQ